MIDGAAGFAARTGAKFGLGQGADHLVQIRMPPSRAHDPLVGVTSSMNSMPRESHKQQQCAQYKVPCSIRLLDLLSFQTSAHPHVICRSRCQPVFLSALFQQHASDLADIYEHGLGQAA